MLEKLIGMVLGERYLEGLPSFVTAEIVALDAGMLIGKNKDRKQRNSPPSLH